MAIGAMFEPLGDIVMNAAVPAGKPRGRGDLGAEPGGDPAERGRLLPPRAALQHFPRQPGRSSDTDGPPLRLVVIPVPQFKYPGPKSVLYTPYKTLFDTLLSLYETF